MPSRLQISDDDKAQRSTPHDGVKWVTGHQRKSWHSVLSDDRRSAVDDRRIANDIPMLSAIWCLHQYFVGWLQSLEKGKMGVTMSRQDRCSSSTWRRT